MKCSLSLSHRDAMAYAELRRGTAEKLFFLFLSLRHNTRVLGLMRDSQLAESRAILPKTSGVRGPALGLREHS
jgi:hypothetical protein